MTSPTVSPRERIAVALVSATLLMTELALTRIFSVIMYYHFAFLAISIALFGLSASGVFAYVGRRQLDRRPTGPLLAVQSVLYAVATVVALFVLVRVRVGLNYSPHNLMLMLTIYALAALPFFAGGLILTLAVSRFSSQINAVYAADLTGAAAGCLLLIPLLDRLGAPGVVLAASALALCAAVLFAPPASRVRFAALGAAVLALPLAGQLAGASRGSTSTPRRAIRPIASSSASGTRFRASPCTSGRTATGRSVPPITARCPTRASWTSTPPRRRRSCARRRICRTSSTCATS